MAANKIVPGPRDRKYGEGPNMDSNNIRPFKRVKKKKNRSTLTASAANKITTFRDKGWRTDYTGSFRVEDDGKLKPQMYLHKIQSKKKKKGNGLNT
tara:strand:- start:50 stop:337 length:288 start_codon:yes stop_codon:yes gene_type:complete